MEYKSFNWALLIEQFEGDEEILQDMIVNFQKSSPVLLEALRSAVKEQDAAKLSLSAHTFKGVFRNFFSEEGSNIAYELEMSGKKSNFENTHSLLKALESQLTLLLEETLVLKKSLDKVP